MGTRSTVHFSEKYLGGKRERKFCSIYQQYDGYPSGVGLFLGKFLRDTRGNGLTCIAAQYVAKIKDSPCNVYMTTHDDKQEYNYYITKETGGRYPIEETITIKVTQENWTYDRDTDTQKTWYKRIFKGDLYDFIRWCENEN